MIDRPTYGRSHGLVRVLFVASLVFIACMAVQGGRAQAAVNGKAFNAGRIIDDSIFFNGNSLSAADIQRFLNAKVPACDTNGTTPYAGSTRAAYGRARGNPPPYVCLRNYRQNIPKRNAEDRLCRGINASTNRSAADIIAIVSQSCGVSPKVILTVLQKEQALVTDVWPWAIQYRSATGYGCPDSAPCSSQYYGFFNQVYNAARIHKYYAKYPTTFNHIAGRNNFILYHPNAACGGRNVYIQNQATAGLYNYTPYQPNAAALATVYGTGDSCSSYGNRNFWRMYSEWFGGTNGQVYYYLIECSGEKYLVENSINRKRPISEEAMTAWGLEGETFLTEHSTCRYPTINQPLGRFVRSRNTGKLYVIDRGIAFRVQSASVAAAWGMTEEYSKASIPDIPQLYDRTIRMIRTYPELPRIAALPNKRVYLIDGGKRHLINGTPSTDLNVKLLRGTSVSAMAYTVDLVGTLDDGPRLNHTFKVGSTWYIADYGKLRRVHPAQNTRWARYYGGPTLTNTALSIFPGHPEFLYGFRQYNQYFTVNPTGGVIRKTTNSNAAKLWGVQNAPMINTLLYRQFKKQAPNSF